MRRFGILLIASANRVYGADAPRLAAAELTSFAAGISEPLTDVAVERIAGATYVTFNAAGITADLAAGIGRHSSAHALFELRPDGFFAPVEIHFPTLFDDDLLTIQKYAGKTNEQFTRLMVNVALWSMLPETKTGRVNPIIPDPVCGRATTLTQALFLGCDARGIEIEPRDFAAWELFVKTWLKDKRLPHKIGKKSARDAQGRETRRLEISIARSRDQARAGGGQNVSFVCADTRLAALQFPKESCDALVGDLPYGVQHKSRDGAQHAGSPESLLDDALPGWIKLLRRGGSVALAWNTRTLSRQALAAKLAAAGLVVRDGPPWCDFSHRVDHTVTRDLIVGLKPVS